MERAPVTDGRGVRARRAVLAALLVWPLVGVRAQEPAAPGQEVPLDVRADATYSDVYLDDSLEAADALARVEQLVSRGRWTEAARLLQQAADGAERKVTRLEPGRYAGTRLCVADRIADFPPAGIEAYRVLYERRAEEAAEAAWAARDLPALLTVFERYFCTARAGTLAEPMAQLALEAGRLPVAQAVCRRVLARHPDRERLGQRYRALLALLEALSGSRATLAADLGNVELPWLGQPRALREILRELPSGFPVSAGEAAAGDWPVFGGNPARNRVGSCRVERPGLLWRCQPFDTGPREVMESDTEGPAFPFEVPAQFTLNPVAAGELVFVQYRREVAAVQRRSGATAWRFNPDPQPTYAVDDFDLQVPRWYAVTVAGGDVVASLPGEATFYQPTLARVSQVVCLDALTGAVRWRTLPPAVGMPADEFGFDASPLVEQDYVYVVGRRRRSFGFEDAYLCALNARDGSVRFTTYLAGASVGTFGARRATLSPPALEGDTVYVCTNLGAVAAVHALTGSVQWVRLYERTARDPYADPVGSLRRGRSWHYHPVIWAADRLVVFPLDAAEVLVVNPVDGRSLQRLPAGVLGDLQTIAGVRGGLLYGAGQEAVAYDLIQGEVAWRVPLSADGELRGRCALTDEALLVPTRAGIGSFGLAKGERRDTPWPADEEGANLLALPDLLLAAGPSTLSAYVRKEELYDGLRRKLAQAPDDPVPALELLEVALRGEEFNEAGAALEEAARRLGRTSGVPDAALRQRLFDDVLALAARLAGAAALTPTVLDTLYEHAARGAPDPTAHVRYRLVFAELFARVGQPERALRLYQQILLDRSLRDLPVPVERGSARRRGSGPEAASTVAWVEAQKRIEALLEQHGRSLYEPYEGEAQRLLEEGSATKNPEPLRRLVEAYPHARAAPLGWVRLGDLLLARQEPEEAARCYAAVYHRYPDNAAEPGLLRRIAEAYVRAGKLEHAYRWLTRAAWEYPTERIEVDGRKLTFEQYRDQLGEVPACFEPSRPAITLPLGEPYRRDFDGPAWLLVPYFLEQPGCRWLRFFVYHAGGIRAFASDTGAEVWAAPAPVRTNAELLVVTDAAAVFTTAHEVFALDPASGARRWTQGRYPPQFQAPEADWEDEAPLRTYALRRDRLVTARDDGTVTCIALENGEEVWSVVQTPAPAGPLRCSDAWVVYCAYRRPPSGAEAGEAGVPVLYLVDALTGRAVDSILLDERNPVEDLFVTLDEQILVVSAQAVTAYDATTRRRLWHIAVRDRFPTAALRVDIDALYLTPDGRRLEKRSLENGETIWVSGVIARDRDEITSVQLQDRNVIVGTPRSVSALDAVTGMTLWEGLAPDDANFMHCSLTDSCALAVHVPERREGGPAAAYFYELRGGSGVIPRQGGYLPLGELEGVRAVLPGDNALIIQAGSSVRGWGHR
ncbi:MAG TPA: PQQ-binding-like beta-propeller repeat protein [Phycisphaerae bacterium]|nr:PQQ-binding-like beta-propeller repeat protein [Phycisphaerae bacterium]HNU44844.1 PQQ-binding-like beta-propeller repeat protein [Phycisphaerae bacterium]